MNSKNSQKNLKNTSKQKTSNKIILKLINVHINHINFIKSHLSFIKPINFGEIFQMAKLHKKAFQTKKLGCYTFP